MKVLSDVYRRTGSICRRSCRRVGRRRIAWIDRQREVVLAAQRRPPAPTVGDADRPARRRTVRARSVRAGRLELGRRGSTGSGTQDGTEPEEQNPDNGRSETEAD